MDVETYELPRAFRDVRCTRAELQGDPKRWKVAPWMMNLYGNAAVKNLRWQENSCMFVNKKLAIIIYGPVFVFSIGNVDLLEFCFVGFVVQKRKFFGQYSKDLVQFW